MINDRYYVKVVPQKSDTVHHFLLRRRHLAAILGLLGVVVLGSLLFVGAQVLRAHAQTASLQQQSENQRSTLEAIDAKTEALRRELVHVQKQNQEIQALIGAPNAHPSRIQKTSWVRRGPTLDAVEANVRALSAASAVTQRQSDGIKTLALRVLNVEHVRSLALAREVAAIPSIDPVIGAPVVGCFCYRTSPDVEFHEGVDLGAGYGETVRAAAAGTIVANGYDGAYGIKIDIDHGNGYHTWYAHLSRADVAIGQHVYKGEPIAAVGATGFATGPHLHYQLMYQGQPIDPTAFLRGVPSNVLAALP
ncbi:MAG: M23 family metallopeptidase [Candidatus Tumulicola sp.]